MNNRSKACSISAKVKDIVAGRDKTCVYCNNRYAFPNAHYIRRSQGGLGIEQNVVMLCPKCHYQFDFGKMEIRSKIGLHIKEYLDILYPKFTDEQRRYKK